MDISDIMQMVLMLAVGVFGFFVKKIFSQLEDGAKRMSFLEREITRQKQQADDLECRLDRIENKIDRLLER